MVKVWPSGAIADCSASSGMYAPVCRSMPTRNSRAGLLSRLPLRGLSQVKLVSQPRGATAILSRSSFAACAGTDVHTQATVTTKLTTRSILTIGPLHRDLCIHNLLRYRLCMRVRESGTATVALVAGRCVCWHSAHAVIGQALPAKAG